MGKVMQVASFSLAEVTYITGDIGYQVQESVKNAQFRVRAKQENVSGVMLPAFESYQEGTNGMLVCFLLFSEGGTGGGCHWELRSNYLWLSGYQISYLLCHCEARKKSKTGSERPNHALVTTFNLDSQRAHWSWSWRTAGPEVQGDLHQGCRNFGRIGFAPGTGGSSGTLNGD